MESIVASQLQGLQVHSLVQVADYLEFCMVSLHPCGVPPGSRVSSDFPKAYC